MKHLYIDVKAILNELGAQQSFTGGVPLEAAKLGEELIEFSGPFEINATLCSINQGVTITGEATGHARLRCSRCLERFNYEVRVSINEIAMVEAPQDPEDVFEIVDGKIDLAAIVYQNVIVEVPIQPLCREACAGLCSECGKSQNDEPHEHVKDETDERLAPLKKYLKENKR
ncbi:MAG TPA: DUF177 domain-containing protein [Actinobacteria bacterium]|nr:DUF177 domain-containing protein [Actinomycetota bacterium]